MALSFQNSKQHTTQLASDMTHTFLIRTSQFLWRGQSSQMLLFQSGTYDRLSDLKLQFLHWCHLIQKRKKLCESLHNS
jgi:hypothetical protein